MMNVGKGDAKYVNKDCMCGESGDETVGQSGMAKYISGHRKQTKRGTRIFHTRENHALNIYLVYLTRKSHYRTQVSILIHL